MSLRRPSRIAVTALVGAAFVAANAAVASATPSTWTKVHSPNRSGPSSDVTDVACPTVDACIAVGGYQPPTTPTNRPLAMVWSGSAWKLSTAHHHGPKESNLAGVACTSATSCIAVGDTYDGKYRPLTEAFDGSAWTLLPVAAHTPHSVLRSTACPSASLCVAVGSKYPTDVLSAPFIEAWNGASWSVMPTPDLGGNAGEFLGVSCASTTSCVAVGDMLQLHGEFKSLIEMYDGTNWSVVPSANPGSENFLHAVSCPTSTMCVAVGDYYGTHGGEPTFIDVWDGTSWTVGTSVAQGNGVNWLEDVSCTSATDCVAVGGYDTGSKYQNLVLDWDGTEWTVVPTPDHGDGQNDLSSVACAAPTSCMAMGGFLRHKVFRTLALLGSS